MPEKRLQRTRSVYRRVPTVDEFIQNGWLMILCPECSAYTILPPVVEAFQFVLPHTESCRLYEVRKLAEQTTTSVH